MKIPVLALTTFFAASTSAFVARPASCLSLTHASASFVPRAFVTVRQMSTDPSDFVKSEIGLSDVVVFSKTYCPFCTATKNLMNDLKIDAKVIELDEVDNGAAIQDALKTLTGQRTVPNVFIKGEHLGGNDVTQAAAKSGKLQKLLGI
ncbi:glutaredoxin [Fragilaria crotonensis]|nr:glutaredoxin [Fragilaria crotonensis]